MIAPVFKDRRVFSTLAAAVVLMTGLVAVAVKAEPVALIVDATPGADVHPFSEVMDGATIELAPQARVTFAHYARCEEVTVESGRLTVWKGHYRLQGGAIVSNVVQRCPKPIHSGNSAEIGGIVLRGSGIPVADRPTFVLTGAGRDDVTTLRLTASGRDAIRFPATSGAIALPRHRSLQTGLPYTLTLMDVEGDQVGRVVLLPGPNGEDLVPIRVE